MKAIHNHFGMLVIVGKDDGLAHGLAAVHMIAPLHQFFQDTLASVFVIEIRKNLTAGNGKIRRGRLPQQIIMQLLLLFRRQFAIFDPIAQQLRGAVDDMIADKIFILNRLLQAIIIIGHTGLAAKDTISVRVHFFSRRCRQANKEAVKVGKDRTIAIEDAAVRLVNDDQVKAAGRKALILRINIIDHGLVSTEHESRIIILRPRCG